jgi:hypothetical protein
MTLKCSDPSCTWRVRYSLRREQDICSWHINPQDIVAVHDMTCTMPLVEAALLRATSIAKIPQILTALRVNSSVTAVVPELRRQRGRPKMKRALSQGETYHSQGVKRANLPEGSSVVICGQCGRAGHNR